MSPAEELRAAAVLLRQRATDATKGPWTTTANRSVWSNYGYVVASVSGRELWPSMHDSAYIATVDPLVGLALADLIESVESVYGNDFDAVAASPEHPLGPQLLVLARLILAGGGS